MHMVAHQYIGMHGDPVLGGRLPQPIEVDLGVFRPKKHLTAVIAPLDDMDRMAGQKDARTAGHV